jgi:hypothetical protein
LSTLTSSLHSHLSHIGQALDTWGHVHATLRHTWTYSNRRLRGLVLYRTLYLCTRT